MSNSRPYGRNKGRDWLLKQQMHKGSQFAQSLLKFEAEDELLESDIKPPSASQQSPYPGHIFRSAEQCHALRLEELILWLIDPYDTTYGKGVYSPVRIAPCVADYIRSHREWEKICHIETVPAYTRPSMAADGETVVPTTEPPALWLWRQHDWKEVYANKQNLSQQTDKQRALAAAVERRYAYVIDNIRQRYRLAKPELLLMMVQEWESLRSTDKMAAQWLAFYGWYEINEEGERVT